MDANVISSANPNDRQREGDATRAELTREAAEFLDGMPQLDIDSQLLEASDAELRAMRLAHRGLSK